MEPSVETQTDPHHGNRETHGRCDTTCDGCCNGRCSLNCVTSCMAVRIARVELVVQRVQRRRGISARIGAVTRDVPAARPGCTHGALTTWDTLSGSQAARVCL